MENKYGPYPDLDNDPLYNQSNWPDWTKPDYEPKIDLPHEEDDNKSTDHHTITLIIFMLFACCSAVSYCIRRKRRANVARRAT